MQISKLARQFLAAADLDGHLFMIDGRIMTAEGEPVDYAPRLISQTAYMELFRAFGRRGMLFFDLYYQLYVFAKTGERPPEGFVESYRGASRLLYQLLTSEAAKNAFFTLSKDLRVLLTRLENGHDDLMTIRRIAEAYGQLVVAVANDRDVFLRSRIIDPREKWAFFRRMTGKEERLERLRRDDADLYESIKDHRKVVKQLDREIEKTILDQGMVPSHKQIRGKLVMTGKDPKSGDLYVFTPDGDLYGVREYIDHLEEERQAKRRLERVFPEDLDQLRRVTDDEISMLAEGPVEHVAITDDKAKVDNLTRIYPVQKVGGEDVVVDGRFKGFYVSDLVHSSGRMIEGTAYDFDPKLGRPVKIETKNPDGGINLRVTREPYCTLDRDGQMYLALPRTRAYTEVRNAMAELAKLVPSIEYEQGSYKARYRFSPKDFAAVREALGGMSLSKAAMEALREYFTELAKHELATSRENLSNYSAEAIGGFRPGKDLYVKQRQCLAWLESRGWNGVGALDTGVGKTGTAIAAMQKMMRDGLGEEGNGKFLYVSPTALVGNLPKAIGKFLQDPGSLTDRVDRMSYAKFAQAWRKDKHFADDYIAVLFDEAQELKNFNSSTKAKAAMSMRHPRKILLTASPMERDPREGYILAAVANNDDLNTKEGRARLRTYQKRFCEVVGGRVVGMKDDPITARDHRVWVKQNLFFADKRDVEEIVLPQLRKDTVALTMDPEIEERYREVTDKISTVMEGLVSKYRDRNPKATDPAIEAAKFRLRKEFEILMRLSLLPDMEVPGARNPKIEQSVRIMDSRRGNGSRTILFTDYPEMAEHTVSELSRRYPGLRHAVAYSDRIEIWQNGAVTKKYRKRAYTDTTGKKWEAADWKVFVLKQIVSVDPGIISLVLTKSYALGQNLQAFDTVIHLDRDSWNSETMKQRTARAWRNGQKNPVSEYTLDMVYEDPKSERDETLDRIHAYMQQLESELFDAVVIESQSEILGKEFFAMKRLDASFYQLNRSMMEMAISPYLARMGKEEGSET